MHYKFRKTGKIKTPPAEDLINPKWTAEYHFDVTHANCELIINIGEILSSGEDEEKGHIKVKVSGLVDQKPHDAWFKIIPANKIDKVSCDLHISLLYTANKGKAISPEDFEFLTLLGRGNYGKVILVKKKDTNRTYAMKILRKETIVPDEVEHTKAERTVLGSINHPFIVSLKYSFQTPGKLYLIQDFINGGDLFFHLKKDISFNEERAKFYTAQLVLALNFLHKQDIVYRDLKPENVLLDYKGYICLVDFGLCKKGISDESSTTFCGTAEYLAPEVLMAQVSKEGYGKEVDWWNLGILLYEMLTGLTPFYSDNVQKMYKNILFAPLVFPAHVSENAKSLLTGLLTRDPKKRLGTGTEDAEPIKINPFFASINWLNLEKRQIKPPFVPNTTGPMDTNNFDPQFTVERPVDSLVDTSKITASMQELFQGFSFSNESLLYSSVSDSLGSDPLRKSSSSPFNNSNLNS